MCYQFSSEEFLHYHLFSNFCVLEAILMFFIFYLLFSQGTELLSRLKSRNLRKKHEVENTKKPANQVTLLVFHSYPNKPCYDGAVSAIQYRRSQERKGIRSEYYAVPYTRALASYQRVAHFLRRMESEANDKKRNVKIVYIDISPEHNEELDYVEELDKHDNIVVTIIDHHSSKHADRLEASFPGRYLCNKGECATLQCGDGEDDELLRRIMAFIQFSEYESEDPKVSGSEECIRIAEIVYRETTGSTPLPLKIDGLDLVYFILDLMMAVADEWIPLYPKDFAAEQVDELNEAFWSCGEKYMTKLSNIVGGKVREMFSDENIQKHNALQEEADVAMDNSPVANMSINGSDAQVLCAKIGIMKYGRSVEPRARKIMKQRKCQYCIFFNPSSTDSHYLSLRRVDEKYNATYLANAMKELSGSKIGGGHPWASGVNLSKEQLQVFVEKIEITL